MFTRHNRTVPLLSAPLIRTHALFQETELKSGALDHSVNLTLPLSFPFLQKQYTPVLT